MPAPTQRLLHRRFRTKQVVRLLCLAAAVLLMVLRTYTAALAANPPPVQTFYIPLPEDQVFDALTAIYPGQVTCSSSATNVTYPINTYISISVISDGTVIYYDHWEDDFEVDVSNPVQPTTEIWGDGDPANGAPPNVPDDVITADMVIVLDNPVGLNARAQIYDFDGGDRVSASKLVAMTRAAWSDGPKTLLAGAVEVYDTGKWGTIYQAPVGEDVNFNDNEIFEHAGLMIMAAHDDTEVFVDLDGDGTADRSTMLEQGESYHVDGGIQAGAVVTATSPVQATLITGDVCDTYESRWYVLFPVDRWSDSYYSPVGTAAGDGTLVFLFNPDSAPLTVHWETAGGLQPDVSVPAGGTNSVLIPDNSGAHFYTSNSAPFAAIAAVDADQGVGFNSKADWGFTLVPESQLTAQILVGWGPGRDPLSSVNPNENGSPVWVMPVLPDGGSGPVQICVDYDGDDSGPEVDFFGFGYDELLTLDEFERARVYDSDGDQTGMVLYVCDPDGMPPDAAIAAAWGQEPGTASPDEPGLDLGTTAPPASSFTAGKGAEVAVDADGDGLASPGDTIRYSVVIGNASRVPIETLTLSDTLPLHTSYVAGSTTFDNGSNTTPVPDNTSGTPFPLDEGGIVLEDLPARGTFTVVFHVVVDDPFPVGVDRIRNVAVVSSGGETERPEVETPIDLDPQLVIEKTTNGVDADAPPGLLVRAGASITWTYQISNTGIVTMANVVVTDSIDGVTPVYVSGDNGNEILDLGESWRFLATGVATAGQYGNVGSVQGVAADGDVATATDPSHYFGVISGLALHKDVSQPVIVSGDGVTYTVALSNTGNVPLSDISISDDTCSPLTFVGGDANSNNQLEVAEIWQYTCSTTLSEDTTNTAVATAIDPLGDSVDASDTAMVDVIAPAIAIDKTGSDDGVQPGTVVTYTYTVTNAGDVPLGNVVLTDDKCSPVTFVDGDANGDDLLDLDETWVYRCAATINQNTRNTAIVTAQDPLGNQVTASDTFFVQLTILYLPLIFGPPPPQQPCPPPEGCPVEDLAHAKGLAVHEGLNHLYVASQDNDRLLIVDPDQMVVIDQAPTGAEPWSVVVDEGSGRIYVSNYAGNDVWVYDVDTLAVLAKIPVGGRPALMAILPDLDTVFVVVREHSRLAVIQGLAKVQDLDAGGSGPYGIAADPINNVIFAGNRESGHLVAFVQVSGQWERRRGPLFDDGLTLFDLAYNPGNNKLYLVYADANGNWFVDVWKPDLGSQWGPLRTGIPVDSGGDPNAPNVGGTGIEVNPTTGTAFNVNTGAATLTVIDGADNGKRDTIQLGNDPFSIAINSRTNIVFVGLREPGRIIKIQDTYR